MGQGRHPDMPHGWVSWGIGESEHFPHPGKTFLEAPRSELKGQLENLIYSWYSWEAQGPERAGRAQGCTTVSG